MISSIKLSDGFNEPSVITNAITTLCKEGYLDERDRFHGYVELLGVGRTLFANGGYKSKFEAENKKELEDGIKKWYDSENARLQFEDYPETKSRATWSIYLSWIAIGLTVLTILQRLMCKTPH